MGIESLPQLIQRKAVGNSPRTRLRLRTKVSFEDPDSSAKENAFKAFFSCACRGKPVIREQEYTYIICLH